MRAAVTTRSRVRLAALCLGMLGALGFARPLAAQSTDAGTRADPPQPHALVRTHRAGSGPDRVDPEAGGQTRSPQRAAGAAGQRALEQAEVEADLRRMIAQRRRELLPEYEHRVRRDGKASADDWLRARATELGRRDGESIRRKHGRGD